MTKLNPMILNASHLVMPSPEFSPTRIVMDYEFDFYLNHNREMFINDTHYSIKKNSLVFRKPGQTVRSIGDYDCYILSLSFSGAPIIPNYSRNNAIIMQPECRSPLLQEFPPVFTPNHAEDIRTLFKKLTYEYKTEGNTDTTHNMIMQLLFLIASDCYDTPNMTYYTTDDIIWDICCYLSENLKEDINMDDLSQKFGFNKSYLIRKFRNEIGLSPINYLINLRLDNAEKLLKKTSYPIQKIAELCGYSDHAFFSTSFKKKFRLSPSEYRNLAMKNK